uniref:Cytochrome P450 n=1 Tax=Bionectria ochroleuca TaxID=29856 RepID=A0A0B7KER5_BIOOC
MTAKLRTTQHMVSGLQSNTLVGFVKAMVMFPDVQAKGQEEIDAVIGGDRLPQWDDRDRLPYIRGIVEETFRCE